MVDRPHLQQKKEGLRSRFGRHLSRLPQAMPVSADPHAGPVAGEARVSHALAPTASCRPVAAPWGSFAPNAVLDFAPAFPNDATMCLLPKSGGSFAHPQLQTPAAKPCGIVTRTLRCAWSLPVQRKVLSAFRRTQHFAGPVRPATTGWVCQPRTSPADVFMFGLTLQEDRVRRSC